MILTWFCILTEMQCCGLPLRYRYPLWPSGRRPALPGPPPLPPAPRRPRVARVRVILMSVFQIEQWPTTRRWLRSGGRPASNPSPHSPQLNTATKGVHTMTARQADIAATHDDMCQKGQHSKFRGNFNHIIMVAMMPSVCELGDAVLSCCSQAAFRSYPSSTVLPLPAGLLRSCQM